MNYKSNLEQEKLYLNKIIDKLNTNIKGIEADKLKVDKELEEMYGNPDFYNEIKVNENLQQVYQNYIESYKKVLNKPYFGKVIYSCEEQKDDIIYIGKKGISEYEDSTNLLVIDWRAPISEVYYNSNLGKSSYLSPEGQIEVDLKLKTTFEIENGRLIDLYDSEIIANDELLVKYLSKNKDVVLNEIVATIQKDQNKIIRIRPSKNLIVQGVAGSGKTTVALHRIAYLLYNYSKALSNDSMYIIASNELFLNYIASMLPDLDVSNINQSTILNLIVELINDYDKNFKYEYTENNSVDINYIKIFEEYFEQLERTIFLEDINLCGCEILTVEDIEKILNNRNDISLYDKATILDNRLSYLVSSNQQEIINFILSNKNNEKLYKEIKALINLEPEFISEEKVNTKFKVLEKKYKKYFKTKVSKLKYQSIFKEIKKLAGVKIKPNQLSINDLALILLILNKISTKPFSKSIKHIVIDEAQDLNTLIFYCLKNVFDKASFTAVGDVMQNIEPTGLHEWNSIIDLFGDNVEFMTLSKSYRNTIEISNFAKKIVEKQTNQAFKTEPVLRHGSDVAIYKYTNLKDKLNKLPNILKELELKNCNLNAIICKDEQSVKTLYQAIKHIPNVELLLPNMEQLNFKNYIVSLKNSKGLEFDGVVIWDFDLYKLESDNYDYKLLYVAITRALHELYIFSNQTI